MKRLFPQDHVHILWASRPPPQGYDLSTSQADSFGLMGVLRLESIRAKILLLALLATLVPAVSTAALSYVRARSALTETLEGELRGIGAQTARELDLWLKERLYDLRVFVGSFEVIENLDRLGAGPDGVAASRLSNYLTVLQERFPEYAGLQALGPDGSVVAEGQDAADHPELPSGWLSELALGEAQVGDPYWHEALGAVATTLAVPIQDADARPLGALVATLTFRDLEDVLTTLAPGDQGSIEVLSAEGRVITSTEPSPGFQEAFAIETRAELAAAGGATAEYEGDDGDLMLGTMTAVPAVGWSVVTHVPENQAYAEVTNLTRSTVLLVSILLLVMGTAAWIIGGIITRPLARLADAAGAVADGDLSVDLPVTGRDEVSYLTQVFNEMVARLRTQAEAIDEANAVLRSQNEELAHLSMTDALTSLHNRRFVMETLDRELSRAARYERNLGVLMMDIDSFKQYNDTHGHQAGDLVLAGMGEVLRDATRDADTPARYGGEEFIVVLPDTDLSGAVDAAERIRERLDQEVFEGGKVTVSIGAAEFPTHGRIPGDIIAAADLALYGAKEAGRDRVMAAESAESDDSG